MTTDHIRYDLLAQDALRSVVRRVLADAAREGLPGEHHFYISFKTQHPGVKISMRLAEKYPDEITIVLQHQFWDLQVSDQSFEVGLSFGNAPEKLVVPFDAVSGFFDPSVQFGLKFEVAGEEDEDETAGAAEASPARPLRGAASEPSEAPAARRGRHAAEGKADAKSKDTAAKDAAAKDTAAKAQEPAKEAGGKQKPLKVVPESDPALPDGEKKIVSLDTFRKKK
jgi:hypothetical protein